MFFSWPLFITDSYEAYYAGNFMWVWVSSYLVNTIANTVPIIIRTAKDMAPIIINFFFFVIPEL